MPKSKPEKKERKATEALTLESLIVEGNKQYGPGTVFEGSGLAKDPPRLPSGVFAVDYACMVGSSRVQDARTGMVYKLEDVVKKKLRIAVASKRFDIDQSRGRHPSGYCCHEISGWVEKGQRLCIRVKTKGGMETEVSKDHYFLVDGAGWVLAKDLKIGQSLVRPCSYRWPFGDAKMDSDYVMFLGYWIAEGCGSGDSSPRIATTSEEIKRELLEIAERKGHKISVDKINHAFCSKGVLRDWRGRLIETNIFKSMLKDLKLWGKTAESKFIPPCLLQLRKWQIGLLLSRMWMGDGTVARNRRSATYVTVSEQLAEQVKFILLRLGVYAYITEVSSAARVFPGGRVYNCKKAFHVVVTGRQALRRFREEVPLFGGKRRRLEFWCEEKASAKLPFYDRNRSGLDSFRDPITSIEPIGGRVVYDVTVEPYHNLVVDGVVNHNTGGGVPIWGSTCFWGPEGGGKTNLAASVVRMVPKICWRCFQLLPFCKCSQSSILMRSLWADAEGTLDRPWVEDIGASPESYVVALCDYGEQYVNVAESALRADDCGLVILDSLASLTPAAEFEAPSEDQFYALQARLIGRAVRKLKQRLILERKKGHPCTIIFTNQLRMVIGKLFGDPETMPGGHAMKHEFSLLLRCVKKALDSERDKVYINAAIKKNRAQRHSFSIRKEKVLTMAGVGEYVRLGEAMDDPAVSLGRGQVNDYNTVMTYARSFGLVDKKGSSWVIPTIGNGNEKWPKLADIKNHWKENEIEYFQMQQEIIRSAKERIKRRYAQ